MFFVYIFFCGEKMSSTFLESKEGGRVETEKSVTHKTGFWEVRGIA